MEQLLEVDAIKDRIIESLKKTKETRREHAFNFCVKNGKTIITETEEGEKLAVDTESKCHIRIEDAKAIGGFHTHTRLTNDGDVIPSPADIIKSVEEDLEFFCIGGNKGNIGIIRCFNKENLLLEINTILELMHKQVTGENIQRASRLMVGRMLSDKGYLDRLSYILSVPTGMS